MKITDVYAKYPVNQGLQMHMVRVAAVVKVTCDSSTIDLPTRSIVD